MNGNDKTLDEHHWPGTAVYDGSRPPSPPADDAVATGDQPVSLGPGLVSLAFITAAIRRTARLWCAMAAAGLLIGLGLYAAFPPAYQASTSVLLKLGPYENFNTAPDDNQAVAESRAVALLAMRKLGLTGGASKFQAAYTVTVVSPDVLQITVSAPSRRAAESRANAVAAAFLAFRVRDLQAQQSLVGRQQYSQNAAYTRLAVKRSVVLDAAAPAGGSRLRLLLIYAGTGLALGLALGLGIVVIRAVTSDRLRWSKDVAQALGAPVKLSIRTARPRPSRHGWWRRGHRGLAAAGDPDVDLVVAYLRGCVPAGSQGPATLAVVPADDPGVAALSVASLAVSCARQGAQVVLADLCHGAPAARLLGAGQPGVRKVNAGGAHLVVAVPGEGDAVPVGPLDRAGPQPERSVFTKTVAGACASVDLVLTLAALDPSLGGEHLATWATTAVAVVTAGRSSATRIHAVGEMLRLAGIGPVSAVLAGADKADESFGGAVVPEPGHGDESVKQPSAAGNGQREPRPTGR